jgi:hypothetical protein
MSFHRKAFLIWLAVMALFVVTASAIGTHYQANDEFRASAMDQLIELAMGHANALRNSAGATDDLGSRAAEKEAKRWEWLAARARTELLNLRSKQTAP